MEQSPNKRVFINPNFKRTEIDCWPADPIKAHFNRHYVKDVSKKVTCPKNNQTTSNNRKIYVNPNFISGNNLAQSAGYVETNKNAIITPNTQPLYKYRNSLVQSFQQSVVNKEQARNIEINKKNVQVASLDINPNFMGTNNITLSKPLACARQIENMNNMPNSQLLHKSKYSLVQNFQQSVVIKEQARTIAERNKDNNQESYQSTKKPTQEVALSRSRYCIVRKKKRLSITVEQESENHSPIDLVTGSNQFSNRHAVQNSEKNKTSCKASEKLTKIKLTKYKIIPVNYLRKNTAVQTNDNKFIASPIKSNTRLSASLNTSNKSRFIKISTPVSTSKTASKNIQQLEKGVCSGNIVKLSKNARAKFNIPCRLFTKYGKCLRQDQGNCKYLHDKKQVSLCRKFLKGICHDKNCSLSHELSAKKMPTCFFFLKGMCTKDGCPYLHVKLSDTTKICKEFVKGYCESGDMCPFKHVDVAQLKKARKTSSYSIRKGSQEKDTKSKQTKNEKKYLENSEDNILEKGDDCRYYTELVNSNDSYDIIKPKRCKLGTLPSFIQL